VATIPVHVEKTNYLLRPGADCPVYQEERNRVRKNSVITRRNRAENGSLIDYIKTESGNISLDVWSISDAVHCSEQNNIKLPLWIADNKTVKEYLHYDYFDLEARLFMNSSLLVRLGGGPLLRTMLKNMQDKIDDRITNKMFIYSAHDTTIMALLAALNVFDGVEPRYASLVILDLYEYIQSGISKHYVKAFYLNGGPDLSNLISLKFPNCDANCNFKKFIKLVHHHIPGNLTDECKKDENPDDVNGPGRDSVILTLSMVIALLISVLFFSCIYFMLRQRPNRSYLQSSRFRLSDVREGREARMPLTNDYDDGEMYGYTSG
jgi:lysosomal acid phosphatase